jgi:hypothetical protein
MRNQLLSITRGIIPYVKELKPYVGTTNACILMQQMEYWISKNSDGFYKFKEPCDNKLYVEGDSWCEELNFSPDEYDNAFAKIGTKYKSKTEYLKSTDKFKGKFYAAYTDKTSYVTYYFRNHELVDKVLDEIISKPNTKANLPVNRESRFTETKQPDLRTPGKSVSIYRTENTTKITTESKLAVYQPTIRERLEEKPPLPSLQENKKGVDEVIQAYKVKPNGKRVVITKDMVLTEELKNLALENGVKPQHVARLWSYNEGKGKFKEETLRDGLYHEEIDENKLKEKWVEYCRDKFSVWARKDEPVYFNPRKEETKKAPEVLNKLPSLYNQPEFVDRASKEEALEGFKAALRAIGEANEHGND